MPTSFAKPINLISTAVGAPYTPGDGVLTVISASGLTLDAGEWVRVVIKVGTAIQTILKATSVSGNVLTLDNPAAIDGYSDVSIVFGATAQLLITAGAFSDIHTAVNTLETSKAPLASPSFTGAPTGDASSMTVLATSSTTARSLAVREAQVFNVKDWGAVGNGGGDDAPAINALLHFLVSRSSPDGAGVPQTVYFPAGNYKLLSPIVFSKHVQRPDLFTSGTPWNGLHIKGEGVSTQIFNGVNFSTDIIRTEDCTEMIIENLRIVCGNRLTNPQTAALHVTAVLSGQNVVLNNIKINGNNNCFVGIGLSLEYDNDLSQVRLYNCTIQDCNPSTLDGGLSVALLSGSVPATNPVTTPGIPGAGIKIGNGLSGNVLDVFAFGCRMIRTHIGVWLNATPICWYGGNFEECSVSDFFLSGGTSGNIKIDGYRSELPNQTWHSFGGGSIGPLSLSNISSVAWFGWTWNYTPIDNTVGTMTLGLQEHYVVVHRFNGTIIMQNLDYTNPKDSHIGVAPIPRYNITAASNVVAMGCTGGSYGDTADAVQTALYNTGGLNSGLNFFVTPGLSRDVGGNLGVPNANPLGFLCNYPARFSSFIEVGLRNVLEVTWPPVAGYYQRGGSMILRKLIDPVSAPTFVSSTGTGSTYYYYSYIAVDQVGNQTLVSPLSSGIPNSSTLSVSNTNTISIPRVLGASYYIVLVATGPTSGGPTSSTTAIVTTPSQGGVVPNYYWNPYRLNDPTLSNFLYTDESGTTTSVSHVLPTRNTTADLTVDGFLNTTGGIALDATYPGTGGTEINGAQTASITDATTQKMVQTIWNCLRNKGLVA